MNFFFLPTLVLVKRILHYTYILLYVVYINMCEKKANYYFTNLHTVDPRVVSISHQLPITHTHTQLLPWNLQPSPIFRCIWHLLFLIQHHNHCTHIIHTTQKQRLFHNRFCTFINITSVQR